MKKITQSLCLILFICLSSVLPAQDNYEKVYQEAIKESMYPPTDTRDTNLIAIVKSNPTLTWKTINNEDYVLMVSMKNANYYGTPGTTTNTGIYQVWVTAANEMKERIIKEKPTDTLMRLKQLLGLPPTANYKYMIEFWVKPSDLFRPCPDKEITDKRCNLCFSHNDSLNIKYVKWFDETRIQRYYACGLANQYPWTQLGYTYDWNPKNSSHIGLCEFVIDVGKTIIVNNVYSISGYFK